MIGYVIGISLYFIGIGIWVAVFLWLSVWGFLFILPAIPALALAFLAGYCTNILKQREEWPEFRKFYLWKVLRERYFEFEIYGDDAGVRLIEDSDAREKLRNARKSIVWAIYPHGHYSLTAVFYWALNPDFSWTKAAIHSVIFYIPVLGSIAGWIGAVGVTESEMRSALVQGHSIFMCPGGVADMANTGNTIKCRHGFLRIAQKTGSIVVPVWCPDERSYYRQWLPLGTSAQRWLGFPVPMFIIGRWWCPLLPLATRQSRILVGKPIDCGKSTPDESEKAYWSEIKRLQTL